MIPNAYSLLDLDPSVSDPAEIERAIEERRATWNKWKTMGTPPQQDQAERSLLLLVDAKAVLLNETSRREESRAAHAEKEKERDGIHTALDERVDFILKLRLITDEDVKTLSRQLKLPEAEIAKRLSSRKIPVDSGGAPRKKKTTRARIDPALEKAIQGDLEALKLENLYAFLGKSARDPVTALYAEADKMYRALHRTGRTDPDTSTRKKLTGHCQNCFRDEESKSRYDETLAVEALKQLHAQMDLAVGPSKFMSKEVLAALLEQAAAQGVSKEPAIDYIEEYAAKKKWNLEPNSSATAEQLQACASCNALSSKDATHCSGCRKPIREPCPGCRKQTRSIDPVCANCKLDKASAQLAQGLLELGRRDERLGQLGDALQSYERAVHHWAAFQAATDARDRVQKALEDRKKDLQNAQQLAAEQKLIAAERVLSGLVGDLADERVQRLREKVDKGLDEARRLLAEGKKLASADRSDEAEQRLQAALSVSTDLDEARRALTELPPPSPPQVKGAVKGQHISLDWDASGPRSYRIVRKVGGRPAGVEDGSTLGDITAGHFDDSQPPKGVELYYAVFGMRGEMASRAAGIAEPLLITEEVSEIRVQPSDQQISLTWKRPAHCIDVEVFRESPGAAGSLRIQSTGDRAADTGLTNGRTYHYRVVACFRLGSRTIRTEGTKLQMEPGKPAPPVMDLVAEREDRVVSLRWTQPPTTPQVRILQLNEPPAFYEGQVLPLAEALQLGEPIESASSGAARTTLRKSGVAYFLPLSIRGPSAVAGRVAQVTHFEEVRNLRSQKHGRNIVLIWDWPEGVTQTSISYSAEASGTSSSEGKPYMRAAYDRLGYAELPPLPPRPSYYFRVRVRDEHTGQLSSGVQVRQRMASVFTVRYRVRSEKGGIFRKARSAQIELTAENDRGIGEILVVRKRQSPPATKESGEVVKEVHGVHLESGRATIPLSESDVADGGYIKLFFRHDEDAESVRLQPGPAKELKVG